MEVIAKSQKLVRYRQLFEQGEAICNLFTEEHHYAERVTENIVHDANLMDSFCNVLLIDADSIKPEQPILVC
jgi:HD superfamily phosphodiesterase